MKENERLISLLSIFSSVPEKDIEVFLKNHSIIDLLTKPYLITDNKECIKNIEAINILYKLIDVGLRDISKDTFINDITNYIIDNVNDDVNKEKITMLFLNDSKQVIDFKDIEIGVSTNIIFNKLEMIKQALLHDSKDIVLVHNRIRNQNLDSNQLKKINELQASFSLVDKNLIDYIVINNNAVVSLNNNGLLNEIDLQKLKINEHSPVDYQMLFNFNDEQIKDYGQRLWKNEKQEKRFIELFSKFTNITQKEIKEEIKNNNIKSLLEKNEKTKEFSELLTLLHSNVITDSKQIIKPDDISSFLKNDERFINDAHVVLHLDVNSKIIKTDFVNDFDIQSIYKQCVLNDTKNIVLAKKSSQVENSFFEFSTDERNFLNKMYSLFQKFNIHVYDYMHINDNTFYSYATYNDFYDKDGISKYLNENKLEYNNKEEKKVNNELTMKDIFNNEELELFYFDAPDSVPKNIKFDIPQVVFTYNSGNLVPEKVLFSLKEADEILKKVEKNLTLPLKNDNKKLYFNIFYTLENNNYNYDGRYDFGEGRKGLVDHLKQFSSLKNEIDYYVTHLPYLLTESIKDHKSFVYDMYKNPEEIITVPFNELDTVLGNLQKRDALQILLDREKTHFKVSTPYKLDIIQTEKEHWGSCYDFNKTVGSILTKYNSLSLDLSETKIPEGTINLSGAFSECRNITALPFIPNSVEQISTFIPSCLKKQNVFIDTFKKLSNSKVPVLDISKEITSWMNDNEKNKLDEMFKDMGVKSKKDLEKVLLGWKDEFQKELKNDVKIEKKIEKDVRSR